MTTLAQYDHARAALAQATKIDEVLPLLDEFELAKVRARQIKDQALLADATEFQLRAERRLGQVLEAAKAAGLFRQGRQPKAGKTSGAEVFSRPTLEEAGIDHKLSSKAQKRAGIAEQAFEAMVQRTRERIASGAAKIIPSEPINGARAIMGSRQEPDDSLDYFPTPPWATRALIECVFQRDCHHLTAWEPACGEGHIAEVLHEYFGKVYATDIHDYGYGAGDSDFLDDDTDADADWIITNPPFNEKAEAFVLRAIERARCGVAMFLRLQWLETVGRYERIFKPHPPALIAQFAERVPLCKGRWDPDGDTATAYLWIVWEKRARQVGDTRFLWIPPGRREALTRPDDAERFTAHPVIKATRAAVCDEPFDAGTGEIFSAQPGDDRTNASVNAERLPETESESDVEHPAPVGEGPAVVDAPCASAAGSSISKDDELDVLTFAGGIFNRTWESRR